MLGLNNLAQGEVIYQDTNLLALNNKQWQPYRSSIQIIFQDPYSALDPKLTINTSLCEGMRLLNKYTPQELAARVDDLLISVGLKPEYKFRYPHEFSGGERQRICIARALSVDPQIIICDEPTSSLDVSVQAQILNLLLKLQRERQLTYLFITHDLNIVRLIADQVVVLQKGKVVEQGAVKQVLDAPQNKYTQDLLQAIPKIPNFAN
jgi:peptide/nickel transport system ATP-binding protein